MGNISRRAEIQTFYENALESSSDEESDGETDLFIAAAAMVNDHYMMPPHMGGSPKKRLPNVDRD
jgi:hypothetical protein